MQTFIYYVQTKSNLGGTTSMFAMIIVHINNVLVISCLSPKPSVIDMYLLIMPIAIRIANLYTFKKAFCWKVTILIFKVDLYFGKIFLRICFTHKIAENKSTAKKN